MGCRDGPPSPPRLGSAPAEPWRSSTPLAASRSVHEERLEIPPAATYASAVASLVPLAAAPSITTARLVFTGRGGEPFLAARLQRTSARRSKGSRRPSARPAVESAILGDAKAPARARRHRGRGRAALTRRR